MRPDGRKHFTKFFKDFSNLFKTEKTLLINYEIQNKNNADIESEEERNKRVWGWIYRDILDFKNHISVFEIDNKEVFKSDFVFADLPLNMRPKEKYLIDEKRKVFRSWNLLINSLKFLSEDGIFFVILPASITFSSQLPNLIEDLSKEGFFCNIILETTKRIHPETNVNTLNLGFQRLKAKQQFIAQIKDDNHEDIIYNYDNKRNENYTNGKFIERGSFISFSNYKDDEEIENFLDYYKNYKIYKVSDIIIENGIKLTKDRFDDVENSIYIPKIGNSEVHFDLEKVHLKHQNIIQLTLNREILSAEFLTYFYNSKLGKRILLSLKTGFIPTVSKSTFLKSIIYIPSLDEQKSFVDAQNKLIEIEQIIQTLREDLSLKPDTKNTIIAKYDELINPFKPITLENKIKSMIQKGESKTVEFKETLSKNLHTGKKDPLIIKSSLKNIVGFLNSLGGTLLVGVADNGEIKGVHNDFFKDKDSYLLNVRNLIHNQIGSQFNSLIDYDLYEVNNKLILKFDCKKSEQPVFLNREDFYTRTNPAAELLRGKAFLDYVKLNFKNYNL